MVNRKDKRIHPDKPPDTPPDVQQPDAETDSGIRLTLAELTDWFNSIPQTDLLTLRDRALIALMAGAGLRVSEAAQLTMKDIFHHTTEEDIPVIRIRNRFIALSQDSWVLRTVQQFTDARGLDANTSPDALVLVGFNAKKHAIEDFMELDKPISSVTAWHIIHSYPATHNGIAVTLRPDDLRRTYARLCIESGMDWNALRSNLGYKDIVTAQRYVGEAVSLQQRIPNWTL